MPRSKGPSGSVTEVRLQPASARPVKLEHRDTPPKFVKPKRIHPRRILPFVREGAERGFHSATARAVIVPHWTVAAARGLQVVMPVRAATDDLSIVLNSEIAAPAQQLTSANVNEPSTSINGQVVFYTGNWYAAVSQDGGQTFKFIDPKTTAQPKDPAGVTFCCDQVVNYLPQIDTFVWLLQYGPDTGDNIQRIGFAKTADVAQGRWRFFDLTTAALGVQGAFLDFPDLAVGANSLYVTTNIFQGNQAGSAVIRIPISGIGSGNITAQPFVSMNLQSFRVAQNCADVAYFAAHQDTSTLAVFSWPEGQASPTQQSVGVARWTGGNGYQSRTPDGRRWLDRADPRITGATLAGTELWFAWSVDSGSNQRPQPFVQIARINATDLTLLEDVNVFDTDSAICYGALSSNVNNEVAISYMIGGGPKFPSHVVGILTGTRKDVLVTAGDRGPLPDPQTNKGEWGDYLTVRPLFPDQKLFAATGYVLKGNVDNQNLDATPHFVIFGRSSDAGPVQAPIPPQLSGTGPVPVTPPTVVGPVTVGDGPITDVNILPTVGADVAAAIKRACMAAGQPAAHALPVPVGPLLVTKPGVERWPVKTGQDDDVALVGKNVIAGQNFGAGIVDATAEELIAMPRTPDMPNPATLNPAFQSKRALPVEIVIWQMDVTIIELKRETDGDYHLVLQGASGATMIGEVPTPTTTFIGTSPWLGNIQAARQAVDDKLVSNLNPADFVVHPQTGMLVPRAAFPSAPSAMANFHLPDSFRTLPRGQETNMLTFKTQVPPTRARVTGVGFFDKVHGQDGVSQANGIELHPVLKIEWL
jgi:hypothetical protein